MMNVGDRVYCKKGCIYNNGQNNVVFSPGYWYFILLIDPSAIYISKTYDMFKEDGLWFGNHYTNKDWREFFNSEREVRKKKLSKIRSLIVDTI